MNESPDDAHADEAYRRYLAQSWWPQPPPQPLIHPQHHAAPSDGAPLRQPEGPLPLAAASDRSPSGGIRPPQPAAGPYQGTPDPAQHWPVVYTGPSPWNPAQPPVAKPPSVWRSIGIGALGLIAGLVAALVLQDVLGMAFVLNGASFPLGIAAVIGSFMPILAVTGVVVALLIDRKARARRPGSGAADRH